jgi:hypothetical protein
MATDEMQAFRLAKEAAALDFNSAIQGVLAGHAQRQKADQERYAQLDFAFLSLLALSKKGAKVGADSALADIVRAQIQRHGPTCEAERDFLAANTPTQIKGE